jgi:undecaprenyl diphosphate synthase
MQVRDVVIPEHVAIIMDGNGRWARKRMMPRTYGHAQGSRIVEQICKDAYNMGIKYLTVYAFSTENWRRPKSEVDELMKLLRSYLANSIKDSSKNNMKVRVIGDISILPDDMQSSIYELEKASEKNTGLQFTVAINYGSRDEIVRAARAAARDAAEGRISYDDINEELFSQYLDTRDIPEPDLLIRTSGEKRLSNFLMWQTAYTELYFTDVLWPDFNKDELAKAVQYYSSRTRKFGTV